MPRIPLADPQPTAPRAMSGARLDVRTTPEQFGSGLAEGVQQVAQDGFRIYQEEAERVNRTRARASALELDRFDLDARQRLQQAGGADAPKMAAAIAEDRRKLRSKLEGGLTGARQRELYAADADRADLAWEEFSAETVVRSTRTYEDQVIEASRELALTKVVDSRRDPAAAMLHAAGFVEQYATYAAGRKLPREEQDLAVQRFRSEAVRGVVEAHLREGDTAAARQAFDTYGNQIDPRERPRIVDALRDGDVRAESQRQADALLRQGIGLDGVQAAVEQISDPAVRDAVQDRLMAGIRLREQARAADAQQAWTAAYQVLAQDPSTTYADLDPVILRRVRQDPELDMRLRSISAKANRQIETDLGAYQELEVLAATRPQEFARADLGAYLGRLSPSDAKRFIEMQAKAKRGDPRAAGWLVDREQLVSQALAQADVDPQPVRTVAGKPQVNQQAIRFRDLVSQEALMLSGGAEPTHDQVRQAITRVQTKTVLVDRWFDKPVPVWQLASDDVPVFSDIPAGEATVIRQQIGQAGGQATDERIARAYAARLRGDAAAYTDILKER